MDLLLLPVHIYSFILHLLPPDRRLLRAVRKAARESALPRHCKAHIVETVNDIIENAKEVSFNTHRNSVVAQLLFDPPDLDKTIKYSYRGAPPRFMPYIVAVQREHFYHATITKRFALLKHVPEHYITASLVMAAIQLHGRALQFVPNHLVTAELAMAAVKQNGWALQWVPPRLVTAELAMAAVQQNGTSLRWVPEGLITAELTLAAGGVQGGGRAEAAHESSAD